MSNEIIPISTDLPESVKEYLSKCKEANDWIKNVNYNVPKEFLGDKENNDIIGVDKLRIHKM
jgi:hypothetical protein